MRHGVSVTWAWRPCNRHLLITFRLVRTYFGCCEDVWRWRQRLKVKTGHHHDLFCTRDVPSPISFTTESFKQEISIWLCLGWQPVSDLWSVMNVNCFIHIFFFLKQSLLIFQPVPGGTPDLVPWCLQLRSVRCWPKTSMVLTEYVSHSVESVTPTLSLIFEWKGQNSPLPAFTMCHQKKKRLLLGNV